ncbi:DgyrCDS5959 [Dimorphilus gyrociliatus]|uniref:DgyrCDS5959 n=1 Tax=Dimorphilus gyrociliatus TaxID=2664684 RepID=A0A7I8VLI6_9ANNE|nr:DgyrCDS5959 [Dimorphilus gyrociliatus]
MGPFKATNLWKEVVNSVHERVEIKKRRVRLRHYEYCFSGTAIVDVVLDTLEMNRAVLTQPISRAKAIKLCQLLLDSQEIFSVVSSASTFQDKQSAIFEDNSHRFYKLPEGICENKENSYASPKLKTVNESAFSSVTRKSSLRGSYSLTPYLRKKSRRTTESLIDTNTAEDIWRDVALSYLLRIVDLPILDSILSYEVPQTSTTGVTNLAFQGKADYSLSSVCMHEDEDQWKESALECIECLELSCSNIDCSGTAGRLQLFHVLRQHLEKTPTSVWPPIFADLHVCIYGLIMQEKRNDTIQALQLAILILAPSEREKLKRILKFMSIASDDNSVQLSRTETNRVVVERAFSDAILKNKLLTSHQRIQLVSFMSRHVEHIFRVPEFVRRRVQKRVLALACGKSCDEDVITQFCEKVHVNEYEDRIKNCTEESLAVLINQVLDDTKMSLKEKKRRLKEFKKVHEDIFVKYFPQMDELN